MATTQIRGGPQIRDGTVVAADCDATIIIAAGTNPFTGDQSMGNHKLTNVAVGSNSADAINFSQFSSVIQGLTQKPTARCATTTILPGSPTYDNGTLGVGATYTGGNNNPLGAIDGVTPTVGQIILVKNQANNLHNGLYTMTQDGNSSSQPYILTRNTDMDQAAEFTGAFIPVGNEGTVNGGTIWLVNFVTGFVVGSSPVTFTQITSPSTYTGTGGIVVTGTVISLTYGSTSSTACQGNDSRLSDARTTIGTALTSAQIIVGNASNLAASVVVSGDVTISNLGVVTADVTKVMKFNRFLNRETPSGTVNGSNTTFTLAQTPVTGTEILFVNGIMQDAGAGNDYTISGGTITFLSGAIPQSGDKIRCSYWF